MSHATLYIAAFLAGSATMSLLIIAIALSRIAARLNPMSLQHAFERALQADRHLADLSGARRAR